MPNQPSRREALVRIAGVAATSAAAPTRLPAQAPQEFTPRAFTAGEFRFVTQLVEMIIPQSDTPGAAAVGVDRIIDEALANDTERLGRFKAGLNLLAEAGFAEQSGEQRIELLTTFSESTGGQGAFFRLLKNMTIDAYYSTEIGLIEELGYQGNSYLKEFPGCDHGDHD